MLLRVLLAVVAVLLSFPGICRSEMLEVGDPFPDWNLVDHQGTTVTSIGYTGRSYLIWFYAAAMKPTCTAEGRGFRDHAKEFELGGIEIVGVSFDPPETNALFASSEGFGFPLLSDTERDLALRVGAAESPDQATAKRISYLVGEDGRIVKVYDRIHPVRHAQEVLLDVGVPAQ